VSFERKDTSKGLNTWTFLGCYDMPCVMTLTKRWNSRVGSTPLLPHAASARCLRNRREGDRPVGDRASCGQRGWTGPAQCLAPHEYSC
jgi:hypothetical protein